MPHAEIYQRSTGTGSTVVFSTVATTASRAWTTFADWNAGERSYGNELAYGASAESIICGADGTGLYHVDWHSNFSVQSTGSTYKVAVCRNGSALDNLEQWVTIRSTVHLYTMGCCGLARLNSPNDVFSLRIYSDSTAVSTANVHRSGLQIDRLSTVSSSLSGKFV